MFSDFVQVPNFIIVIYYRDISQLGTFNLPSESMLFATNFAHDHPRRNAIPVEPGWPRISLPPSFVSMCAGIYNADQPAPPTECAVTRVHPCGRCHWSNLICSWLPLCICVNRLIKRRATAKVGMLGCVLIVRAGRRRRRYRCPLSCYRSSNQRDRTGHNEWGAFRRTCTRIGAL